MHLKIYFLAALLVFALPSALSLAQTVQVVAGGGTEGEGALATKAKLIQPFATGMDAAGSLYIAEMEGGERILKVDKRGRITKIAGTGEKGFSGDGGLATKAQINGAHHLLVQPNGDVLLADTFNRRIRKIDTKTKRITTIAGTGEAGFSGDGGLATAAKFGGIYCLALDAKTNRLYACDLDNRRIRAIDMKTGIVTTVAGNGKRGAPQDGTSALEAPLVDPRAIALDSKGSLYILERGGDALRVVARDGKIRTVIGKPLSTPLALGALNGPKHLSVDAQDNVLIADTENNRILKYVPKTGVIAPFAGSSAANAPLASQGANLSPLDIRLDRPHGVFVAKNGDVYLADSEHGLVLRVPGNKEETMNIVLQPEESQLPKGWESWSPRAEIAPRTTVEAHSGRGGQPALRIACDGNPNAFGGWRYRATGVVAGKTYRFTACYKAKDTPREMRSVSARLDWLDANGERPRPPDYAHTIAKEGEWTRVEYVAVAPENAHAVLLEFALGWAAKGVVLWSDVQLTEVAPAEGRTVRAMTIYHRPRNTRSIAESVEEFCKIAEAAAAQKPDILCLPEGITGIGTGKTYYEASEPVPGPTTKRLGELAKALHCYIVAGVYERAGKVLYNTAVLMGRSGELEGVYRKTHLPREEVEGGVTAGDSYPVFHTDFGTIGMMICWDVQFPEPARAMGIKGAEMILLPIAGGSETLAKARAIENHLFLVTSSYDMKTFIVDPTGEVMAEANREKPVALAELRLDKQYIQPWLGDMKPRAWKERRPDIPVE